MFWVSQVLLQWPPDVKEDLTPDSVMNKQTQTFRYQSLYFSCYII